MVIRSSVLQLATPPEMRGRVSAVNWLFIGASNEFGEFESGLTAHWFGAVRAVVLGGIGSVLVTGWAAGVFPALRNADALTTESLRGADAELSEAEPVRLGHAREEAMESGKKAALGATVLLLAVVGVRVGMIYHERHAPDVAPAPAVAKQYAGVSGCVCVS